MLQVEPSRTSMVSRQKSQKDKLNGGGSVDDGRRSVGGGARSVTVGRSVASEVGVRRSVAASVSGNIGGAKSVERSLRVARSVGVARSVVGSVAAGRSNFGSVAAGRSVGGSVGGSVIGSVGGERQMSEVKIADSQFSLDSQKMTKATAALNPMKKVLTKIPRGEKVFLSKYSYDESLVPTEQKEIPAPKETIRRRTADGSGDGDGGCGAPGCCCCGGDAGGNRRKRLRLNPDARYKSRSLFFADACDVKAFSSAAAIKPTAMTKIDKINSRIYTQMPEFIIRKRTMGGCSSDCLKCSSTLESERLLPDSCRCYVHSLKGRSKYSIKVYDENDINDDLGYNNMTRSYFSSFWPYCEVCPMWEPCSCLPGAKGMRIGGGAPSSESSSSTTVLEEDAVTGEIKKVHVHKHKATEAEKRKQMSPDEIAEKVERIAEATTDFAHQIFMAPEFLAEIVEDIPDPKVFVTETGEVHTRLSITRGRFKIENVEVTETLSSAIKYYVQGFEEFDLKLDKIPNPKLFLDHDGIVRSPSELLANRKKILDFIIEKVEVTRTDKDFASMQFIHEALQGRKLLQAMRSRLEEVREETLETMEDRKIDPTGLYLDFARRDTGKGGQDAPLPRTTSDLPVHDITLEPRTSTRFYQVARGDLGEDLEQTWTPELTEKIAFVIRYPQTGPREEELMDLMAKFNLTN